MRTLQSPQKTGINNQNINQNSIVSIHLRKKQQYLNPLFSLPYQVSLIIFSFFCLFCSLTTAAGTESNQSHSAEIKTIGISQIVEHPALNDVRKGILTSLNKHGFKEGKNITVHYENAQGNISVSSQIATKLLSGTIDVGIAISTPSAQSLLYAAKRNDKKIPIVFTAVSDPALAKLEPGNTFYPITGVTDAPNLDGLLEVIEHLMPNIKTLGIMYNPAETNSVSTVSKLKKLLKTRDIIAKEVTVNTTNDVSAATQSLIGNVDALYFPQDNTVVAAIESLLKVTHQASPNIPVILPIFTSDPLLVKEGVLAAVGYDYFDLGLQTGDLVAQILKDGFTNTIPIQKPSVLKTVINKSLAEKLGLKIPSEFKQSKLELLN